ncbi:MAG: putative Glutamate racemase [Candidatus Saccharibacteria bacterium]|nr:putative Glutamate racemase [Candidatus Saccharibacteria bacterium]
MKVGVFDSGIGGLSVVRAIERDLPAIEVLFRNDSEHMPYGTKSPAEIYTFIVPIMQSLIDEGCAVIVIACNTVTTTLIKELRAAFTVPFVAVEPMVKPAARLTTSKIIAVCATPTTLASPQYALLKDMYAQNITVLEPDCSDWASMIERQQVDNEAISNRINEVIDAGVDVIVLGCTHYHWIEEKIRSIANGRASVIQPEAALVRQLQRVLSTLP